MTGRSPRASVAVVSWADSYGFEEPFHDLRSDPDACGALGDELERELGPGHELKQLTRSVVARALSQDDVVLRIDDGVALVHLTWSGHAEPPPFPRTARFGSCEAFEDAIAYRY